MAITKFEDLLAWQKAQDIAVLTYANFKSNNDYGFRDQICRTAVSISNNIAEGFDRKGKKEFIQFLYIAVSSASEVKSMIYLAHRLEYVDQITKEEFLITIDEAKKLTYGLIRSVRRFDSNEKN